MLDFYRFKHLSKEATLLHLVTTKQETSSYQFSLALHTGEKLEKIKDNRFELAKELSKDKALTFVVANQVHGDSIAVISHNKSLGWEDEKDAIASCDALITDETNLMLSMLTADCVPLLMYDKKLHIIAAIHAGWKGTKAKIAVKTVKKMKEVYGSKEKDILVGIAPAIGGCCYEVGEEVAKHFLNYPKALQPKGEKTMLNLPLINELQLLDIGILSKNIEQSHICTSCEVQRFFSYRKEDGCSGRFMSMIGIKSSLSS